MGIGVINERYRSRDATIGVDESTTVLRYVCTDCADDVEAIALANVTVPPSYNGLALSKIDFADQGDGKIWHVEAHYGLKANYFSFDVSGENQHITQSIKTSRAYSPPDTPDPPSFNGAIGVNNDSVEGCDVEVPKSTWTETYFFAPNVVTQAYQQAVHALYGKTNQALFRGRAIGEVKFKGASGSQHGSSQWEIAFKFEWSQNRTDLTVGQGAQAMTDIVKGGHEYLWVRYEDATSNDVLVKQPAAVYVEQVVESGDFSVLLIGN